MRKFVLSIFAVLLLSVQLVMAQSQIKGRVTSTDGDPLPGVTVLVKGTHTATATNNAGEYAISATSEGVLVFSFIGMETKEVAIHNKTVINEVLVSDAKTIDDVIVVAFGTAKKEAFTGSASVVKGGDLVKRQVDNISKALSGQVAGVQAASSTGQPGSVGKIRIRGIGSISASSEPLYVVDGIPFDGDIGSLNPSDIESLTVLKDAASNALYGARGANGVILVTTKRGRMGEAVVNFDAKWGVNSRAVPEYNTMNSAQQWTETWYSARNNYYLQGGLSPEAANANANLYLTHTLGDLSGYNPFTYPAGEMLIGMDGKLNPNATLGRKVGNFYLTPDNWGDAAYNNEFRQEYNLNVSGASEKMNYFFSLGYLDDNGYVVNSDYKRITARLRADYQVKKWLKVGGNASYANANTNSPDFEETGSTNMFYMTRNMSPIFPLYVRDGEGNIKIDNLGLKVHDYGNRMNANLSRPYMSMANPIMAQTLDKRQLISDMFGGKAFAEVVFLKDFKATANVGVDIDNTRLQESANPFYGQFAQQGGYVSVKHTRDAALNLQQLLSWSHDYGKHHVDALAGHETYSLKRSNLWGNKNKIYNPDVIEIDNAIMNPSTGSKTNEYNTEGFFVRGQYDYNNKYFFSGSYRRDASSRFAPENRWGNFWSVGASWLLSSENFLSQADWINMLKFKISYGSQGNDGLLDPAGYVNYYPYLDQYKLLNNGGEFALSMNIKGNRNIKWETNYNFNTGVEFSFFNDRLSGGVEFFTRTAKDLLFNRPVAPGLGYATYPDNIGDMRNVGFEIDLRGTAIETKNFRWTLSLNGTHYSNKILSLPPENRANGLVSGYFKMTEGGSRYDYYMRDWAGVNPETGAAMWYKDIKDANGAVIGEETTEVYQEATQRLVGKAASPDFYGGFGTSFEFYGVDVSIGLTYQIGGWAYDTAYAGLMHTADSYSLGRNWHKDILDAWSPTNKNSKIPIVDRATYTNSTSSRFLVKASYLNIQNISVGYTLPSSITNKWGMGKIRVYAVADNVALFSKRKGFDPRQFFDGVGSYGAYAPIRTVSGGIQLQF